MIKSVLIANRGEIACRIIRTCQRLGVRTVALFSEVDAAAKHVIMADTAVFLNASSAADTYLNQPAILEAARQTGVAAIHPGYGFLAENSDFARLCTEAGFLFIGPNAEAIALMGNKRKAKELMMAVGVPLLPGYAGKDQRNGRFLAEAEKIGLPIMVKAVAGGGGKGMRVVFELDQLLDALDSARREALQAFGSDELLLEKAIFHPRHVEIQIFGDQQGNLIHLGERDCSIQRRHQKIIEESPSPALTPELRQRMGETAVAAARAVHYDNAGTVEFLLDDYGGFYFLEMNTRLQVEHPVTEMVTGLDVVAWQLAVAAGEPLPLSQDEVTFVGHAVEARVYAENPANDFLPVTGEVLLWRPPVGEGIRVDDGIQTGDAVSVHYDPLLVKIIAYGADRETAVLRLRRALQTAVLLGFIHNLPYLRDVVRHTMFLEGRYNTQFTDLFFNGSPDKTENNVALLGAALVQFHSWPQHPQNNGYWRNNSNGPLTSQFSLGGDPVTVLLQPIRFQSNQFEIMVGDGELCHVVCEAQVGVDWVLLVNGRSHKLIIQQQDNEYWVQGEAGAVCVTALPRFPRKTTAVAAAGSLRAPMPGTVLAVLVNVGQTVAAGDPLLKLEAMKMEHTIRAAAAGVVAEIFHTAGDSVAAEAQLLRLEKV